MRNFPDFIEAFLQYADNHESTKKVQTWAMLSVIAGVMERKIWMDRAYYTLYPNLYVFIIGKSGLIKKSTSTSIAINLMKELETVKFMSERLTAGSLIQQLCNSNKPFFINDKEINQSPVFAYASELAVFMGEVYGQIIELLTTFYDCQPNDPSKPWVYESKHGGTENIFGPCLNILGASTKEWLRKCIPKSEHEGGFTSRCIFVVENSPPSKFVAWPELPRNVLEFKTKLVEDLDHIHNLMGQVKIHPEAKKLFAEWYEDHMRVVMPKNTDGRFTGYLSRKGDLILKLSMVRSVTLGDDLLITPEHLRWAGQKLQEIEKDMMLAFSNKQVGKAHLQSYGAQGVYDFIKSKGKVSQEQLMQEFPAAKGQVMEVMNDLMGMEKVEFTFDNKTQFYEAK